MSLTWPQLLTDLVGRNDGVLMNGATVVSGLVGPAFHFDGVKYYVQVNGPARVAGPRTIEAWVFPRTHTGSGMPIATAGVSGAGETAPRGSAAWRPISLAR